ncbi:MAG TPA: triple tyrosine motif-containing protein, partial [Flavisolibacter sp.]|nr:triple tyrosine motif-containing protein [Flavisolibacter sp.]
SNEKNVFVNTIYEDENNNVWLGTFENGIRVLNKRTGKLVGLKLPGANPKVNYSNSVPLIQHDSKGNVWTSMSGYLYLKENGRSDFASIKIPSPSNALLVPQVWSFSEYLNGWLLGTTIGLYHVQKEENRYLIRHLPQFGQNRIFHIWVSPGEEIWIAFESGGIAVTKNLEAKTKRLFTETNVRSFLYDEKHALLWMSSSSGLIAFHIPTGRFKNFTEEDGLLNDYVYGALPHNEDLWISTNNGLSKASVLFNNNEVLPTVRFRNFTTEDGLSANVFNARAFHKGASGNFYFGTPMGVTWFNPVNVKSRKDRPVIQMTALLVNEQKVDTLAPEYITQLSLPHFQNNLFFRFRGIDFRSPEKIKYAYMLDGWDEDWIYSKQLNEVRYSNLPPGDYTFKIKASNASGDYSPHVHQVSVTIFPPFWKTWWFRLLVAIAILSAAIFITTSLAQRKLRRQLLEMEKQRAIEAERNRISIDMHDEIGSGLTHIALLSELIQTQKKAEAELKKDIGAISASARKLVENMSEIIWALNPHNDTLENLLAYLREQTMGYFEP